MATRGDVEYADIMRQKVPSWKVGDRIKMKPGRGPSGMTGKIVKVISPPSSSIYLTRYEIDGELGEWLKENTENPTGFDILAANAARSTNATFKVGDWVEFKQWSLPPMAFKIVKELDSISGGISSYKTKRYVIETADGKPAAQGTMPEDIMPARASTPKATKKKIDEELDKRKSINADTSYSAVNAGFFDGAYEIERLNRNGKFKVYLINPPNKKLVAEFATRDEAEKFVDKKEKASNTILSRNAIVAKALNAVARNYDVKPGWTNRWSGELKTGTKITVVDAPMRYGGMAGEVVRRDGSRYVVRLDDIAGMEVQLNPNQISVKNAATGTVSEKAVNAGNYSEKQIIDAAMQTLESRLRSISMPGYSGPTRGYFELIYKPNTTPKGSFSGEISAEANITEETTFDEAKAGKFGVVVHTSLGRLAPRTKIFGSINEAVSFIKGQVMPKAAKFLSEGQAKRQSDMAAKRKEDSSRRAYEKYGAVSYSNSRARNAAGYVDASSVVLYPGDSVVFKAQYSSHKDDDEWLERNGDTVREVRGNEVKIGPSANYWAKKSDLMVWHNAASSRNAKFKVGDEVRVTNPHLADRGRYGRVVSAGVDGNPLLYDVDLGGGVQLFSERDLVAANSLSRNAVVQKALNAATARNASTDGEFAKLKAMGKAAALKYIQDNSQALIDKYGYKEFADMAKRIQALRLKPIKKGRFAGKYGQMTYYVDYTADSWAAKTYGKDGTNITEIQVTGPYVVDPDGKERRHIWYEWSQGREVIKPENGDVAELVKRLLAGSDAIKAGDPEYAWNSSAEGNHIVANAMAAQAKNAMAMNWNYKNSYQFFCVDPSLKAPCILSGWDYREDAKDDAAELKELGIPHKIVSRRFLEQQGIDPNAESSWKKNRR